MPDLIGQRDRFLITEPRAAIERVDLGVADVRLDHDALDAAVAEDELDHESEHAPAETVGGYIRWSDEDVHAAVARARRVVVTHGVLIRAVTFEQERGRLAMKP